MKEQSLRCMCGDPACHSCGAAQGILAEELGEYFHVMPYHSEHPPATWYQVLRNGYAGTPPREVCRCAREGDARLIADALNSLAD